MLFSVKLFTSPAPVNIVVLVWLALLFSIKLQFCMFEATGSSKAVYLNNGSLFCVNVLFAGLVRVITGAELSMPTKNTNSSDSATFLFEELSVHLTCHLCWPFGSPVTLNT